MHLAEEKKDMTEMQYGQEYMGLFLDDLRRFYSDEWIDKVCVLKRPTISPKEDNYIGVDIARMGGDKSTYEILHIQSEKLVKQIAHFQEDHKLTTHTEKQIIYFTEMFNCEKVGIDAGSGSLGVGIYDHLLENPTTRSKVPSNSTQK